jgi:type IX secretion system PorP/SprF family membrane protein
MRVTTTTLFFVVCTMALSTSVFGQQDPMFTKYMFNSLTFNPGYAGSHDHMTLNLIHRQQWVGIEGAPITQSFVLHSPLRNDRVGVGLSVINDNIGAVGTLDVNGSYAYRIPLGKKTKLAVGLQAGVTNWRSDWSKVSRKDAIDPVFDDNVNKWLPNFGAGLYLQSKKYYIGMGCPKLVEYDLRKADATTTPLYAKSYRHYFATAGLALPLGSDNLIFKPSVLVKSAAWFGSFRKDAAFNNIGAPTEFDIDMSMFFFQTLWVGLAYRSAIELSKSSNDSADFWVAYFLKNGMRIGAAYDYTLTDIRKATSGSFEIMLGYEFDYKTKRVVTPRYF